MHSIVSVLVELLLVWYHSNNKTALIAKSKYNSQTNLQIFLALSRRLTGSIAATGGGLLSPWRGADQTQVRETGPLKSKWSWGPGWRQSRPPAPPARDVRAAAPAPRCPAAARDKSAGGSHPATDPRTLGERNPEYNATNKMFNASSRFFSIPFRVAQKITLNIILSKSKF